MSLQAAQSLLRAFKIDERSRWVDVCEMMGGAGGNERIGGMSGIKEMFIVIHTVCKHIKSVCMDV